MTRSSEQLERDAEQARAQIAGTLDQLRNRLTPGQVVDELFDYGRQTNVGEFARSLGRDVRGNPLPLMLIGAGIETVYWEAPGTVHGFLNLRKAVPSANDDLARCLAYLKPWVERAR